MYTRDKLITNHESALKEIYGAWMVICVEFSTIEVGTTYPC